MKDRQRAFLEAVARGEREKRKTADERERGQIDFSQSFFSDRFTEIGISDTRVLEEVLHNQSIDISQDMILAKNPHEVDGDVHNFLSQVGSQIEELRKDVVWDRIRRIDRANDLLVLMTALLPMWRSHKEASATFSAYIDAIGAGDKRTMRGRNITRALGLHFDEYGGLLPPQKEEEVRDFLIEHSPLSILPSSSISDTAPNILKRYGLDDPVSTESLHLLSTPYFYNEHEGVVEDYDFTACDSAEALHADASLDSRKHIKLFLGNEMVGAIKFARDKQGTVGERSILATRGVVQGGNPILLKGALYQFHGLRLSGDNDSVDLTTLGTDQVNLIPIRMWRPENTEGLAVGDLEKVTKSYNTLS